MSNRLILKKHKQHKKQEQYHHGNLRQALLDAGMQILQFQGVEALGLRSLARILDVSQTAPYSHFKNKTELLAAIAELGFANLAIHMLDGAKSSTSPINRIENFAISYVEFALKNKELFSLMFRREFGDMKDFPTLLMTASKSYSLFSSAVGEALSKKENSLNISSKVLANSIWSLVGGLAIFAVDGKISIDFSKLDEFVTEHLKPVLINI